MAKNINCNLFTYRLVASAFLIQYTVVLLWLLAKDCNWSSTLSLRKSHMIVLLMTMQ